MTSQLFVNIFGVYISNERSHSDYLGYSQPELPKRLILCPRSDFLHFCPLLHATPPSNSKLLVKTTNATSGTGSCARCRGAYFLPAVVVAFFASAGAHRSVHTQERKWAFEVLPAACFSLILAATFSFSRIISLPDMVVEDFWEASWRGGSISISEFQQPVMNG